MIYTITKAITTYETYTVESDSPENAVNEIERNQSYYFIESDTIEPEYTIVNVEK